MQSSSTPRNEGSGRRSQTVPCRQCKKRQLSWKGSSPRCRPYEKVDAKCEHQSGSRLTLACPKCHLTRQEDGNGSLSCANPECQPPLLKLPFKMPWPSKHDTQVIRENEQVEPMLPLILRTYCRNCRIDGIICSGSITDTRCEWCEEMNLDCDCKVQRKTCAECMKIKRNVEWKGCVGFYDACVSCIEKGITQECKEYVPGAEEKCSEEKQPKDVVADGTMDIIEGMKAAGAFAACERYLEEKVKCDESLLGCGGCAEKGMECRYRLLETAFSDFSWGRRIWRRGPSRRSSELNDGDQASESASPVELPARRRIFPVACSTCMKCMVMCLGTFLTCDRCEKLGVNCYPKSIPAASDSRAKAQENMAEAKVEILEEMMSDLELGGWHLISREEIEEAINVESGKR